MAGGVEVFDYVPGMPASVNIGGYRVRGANKLERVIALHRDPQAALKKEAAAIEARVKARMAAVHLRRRAIFRNRLRKAIREGDPSKIKRAQEDLAYYEINKTQVWSGYVAEVDYHIGLYRPDGRELHVEVTNAPGGGGLHILKQSLTR